MAESVLSADRPRLDVGAALLWCAGVLAGLMVHCGHADLRLAHPGLLLPACLWLLWPARGETTSRLQRCVWLCLIWMLLNASFEDWWRCQPPWEGTLYVSATVAPVGLMLLGHCVVLAKRKRASRELVYPPVVILGSVIVLGAHMLILLVVLRQWYGFGWERDAAVLGRVGLFAIVAIAFSPVANSHPARAGIGSIVALVLLARSIWP